MLALHTRWREEGEGSLIFITIVIIILAMVAVAERWKTYQLTAYGHPLRLQPDRIRRLPCFKIIQGTNLSYILFKNGSQFGYTSAQFHYLLKFKNNVIQQCVCVSVIVKFKHILYYNNYLFVLIYFTRKYLLHMYSGNLMYLLTAVEGLLEKSECSICSLSRLCYYLQLQA